METRKDGQGWVARRLTQARDFLTRDLWSLELARLPTFRAVGYQAVRVVYLALSGFREHRCMFRASALTYITVLSIVPLLAFAFSVAKGLGAYDRLINQSVYPFLDSTFAPQTSESVADGAVGSDPVQGGAEVRHAIDQVLAFVKETDFANLGLFGLAVLLYAVIKLCSSVEHALNAIWGVHRSRSLLRKLSDYLSMVVVVPILLVTATGVSAAIQNSGGFMHLDTSSLAPAIRIFVSLTPLLALWIGFSLVYLFMPNTRTRVSSALLGGVVGGSLWHLLQIGHVRFQLGVANYNAIYASFAAFPIFMVWIYFSWVTLLFGAEFAFAHQHEPTYRQIARARHHDHTFREGLALRLMVRVGALFVAGRQPASTDRLALDVGAPERSIEQLASQLREAGILAMVEDEHETCLLPARDLDQIRITHILSALKSNNSGPGARLAQGPEEDGENDGAADRALSEFEVDIERSPKNRTLRDLSEQAVEERRQAGPESEPA